jgi:mannose-6-phosphate isomerase
MSLYPLLFEPLYMERIWGGRNLERLFGRDLPAGAKIGESWELTDLPQGVSRVSNGPLKGMSLTDITQQDAQDVLGEAQLTPQGRFPLLLKLLDANDILSLQVHPDEQAVRELGAPAALKTECWYVLESRGGFIYKGTRPGVTPQEFRRAIETGNEADVLLRYEVSAGDFHYLPAGMVHALGPGVVIAEVQTPSDTTYRVTDWGRGREIHIEQSMRCIRFGIDGTPPAPSDDVNTLLNTDYFTVQRHTAGAKEPKTLAEGCCIAIMVTAAEAPVEVQHDGPTESVYVALGDTVLVPASLKRPRIVSSGRCDWLEISVPGGVRRVSPQEAARRTDDRFSGRVPPAGGR